MFIAIEKRSENIAEYILYLWQLEDTLRALNFNQEKIYSSLVAAQESLSDHQKLQLIQWYVELGELLQSEDKATAGHLEHTLHLIGDLNTLHNQLLTLPVGVEYKKLFNTKKSDLEALRQKMQSTDISDIELCFRALYSVILLRLRGGDDQNKHIKDVLEVVSPLIAQLSNYYKRVEEGTINLFEE